MTLFPTTLIHFSLYWLYFAVWFFPVSSSLFYNCPPFHRYALSRFCLSISLFSFLLFLFHLLTFSLLSVFLVCWRTSPVSHWGQGLFSRLGKQSVNHMSFLPSVTQSRLSWSKTEIPKGIKKGNFSPGQRNKIADRKWPWPLLSNLTESLTKLNCCFIQREWMMGVTLHWNIRLKYVANLQAILFLWFLMSRCLTKERKDLSYFMLRRVTNQSLKQVNALNSVHYQSLEGCSIRFPKTVLLPPFDP